MLTLLLIGITALISLYAFKNTHTYYRFMMNPYSIRHRKQYDRFLSSGFIHNGYMHLIFNMFTLYFFGQWVEYSLLDAHGQMGWVYFLLIYLGGIVVSDIPTYQRYKDAPHYNSLGASGGVSAIVFVSILYEPLANICLYAVFCFPAFLVGGVYVIYSYVYSKESADNINHSAHLIGALYGFVVAASIRPTALLEFITQIGQWNPF